MLIDYIILTVQLVGSDVISLLLGMWIALNINRHCI